MIIDYKDSVFIFDSNSLDAENLGKISQIYNKLNPTLKIIIILNKSDNLSMAIASRLTTNNYYLISDKFQSEEINTLNHKLNDIGIPISDERKSFIDNCYRYFDIYGEKFPLDIKSIKEGEFKLTLLLAADGKAYSLSLKIFELTKEQVEKYVSRFAPFVEIVNINELEAYLHSGFKIVSNSASWLFRILGEYQTYVGPDQVSAIVMEMVSQLIELRYVGRTYQKLISFDFLNQAFFKKEKGSVNLIASIYEKLENILSDDGQFWLQRSKSLFYLKHDSLKDLYIAADYAKKAYHDATNIRLRINATTNLALISGRIAAIHEFKEVKSVQDAIEWYYEALEENEHNRKYVKEILQGTKRNRSDLRNLVSSILMPNQIELSKTYKKKAEKIINKVALFK